jgi:mannosyltransferase OCH1-like enzyme
MSAITAATEHLPLDSTIWTYWENSAFRSPPAHITLARWALEYHCGCSLRYVTKSDLARYLPDLDQRIHDIRLRPRGRLELLLQRRTRRLRAVPTKVDFIRAVLLRRYGGFWIDADAVVLADLHEFLDYLREYEFVATRRQSFGRSHIPVNFYGSQSESSIIDEYVRNLTTRLQAGNPYGYNELGAHMLSPIVDRYEDRCLILPERTVQPVTYEKSEEILLSSAEQTDEILPANQKIFMLFGGPFRRSLKNMSIQELYNSDRVIGAVFRRALPEDEFERRVRALPERGRRR